MQSESGGVLALEITTPNTCVSAPLKPALVSPIGSATVNTAKAPLDWDAALCATSYNILVKQDSKSGATVWNKTGVLTTDALTKKLTRGKTYYWRIQACNPPYGCTNSVWGKFKISP